MKLNRVNLTVEQAQAYYRQLECEICQEDCRYWIEHYANIEDRDSPNLAAPFALWPRQADALRDFTTHRLNIALKARQLGLSWLALAYATWMIWRRPGVSVIVMSRGETESKEMARRVSFILRHLPGWMVSQFAIGDAPAWESTTSTVTIRHAGGEPSVLQSMPAAQNSGRSFTANLIILDEWAFQTWATEIWASIFPSINRQTGGQVIGISTIERGTLFEDIWIHAGDNGFNKIFLPWHTDPRRDEAWYERTKRAMGDAVLSEYPETPEEALSTPGGSFFPELREVTHIVPLRQIPEWWTRVIAMDYGMDMLAAYWIAISDAGKALVYRELYQEDLVISQAAEAIKRMTGNEKISTTYGPPDMWNIRQDTGRSAAEIFAAHGLPLYRATNDRENGWLATHEWLLPREVKNEQTGGIVLEAELTIQAGSAPHLWRTMTGIQKNKNNPKDAATQPHELTHAPDAIRYFCASRTRPSTEPKPQDDDRKSAYETARKALTGGAKAGKGLTRW
jgi:hypothetical protein